MTNEGTGVPAGWYPTPDGQQRYWDGFAWTNDFAPGAAGLGTGSVNRGSAVGAFPTSDERTTAMVAHLLGLGAAFIGPLIIYLIKKDESPFVRDQAAEALNFAISMAIYFTAYIVVSIILIFVIVGIFMLMLAPFLALGVLALHIVAAVRANRGEYFRYPLTIRLIK